MLKAILAAVVVLAAAVLAILSAQFTVAPDRMGVVVRGETPVRLAAPGLRWRIPLLESVAEISTTRLHQHQMELTVLLSDASDCRVLASVEKRVVDPIRAYLWRASQGLPGGDADSPDAASEYTVWSAAFAAALRDAARAMTPDAAAAGAIRSWSWKLNAGNFDDGTAIVAANVESATCWDAATEVPSIVAGDRAPPRYGALNRFARSAVRPASPEDAPHHVIELRPDISIDRMGRRLQTEGLTVRIRAVDKGRAEAVFGAWPAGLGNAAGRIQSEIAAELRRIIGDLDQSGLESFDPYVAVGPGSVLASRLAGDGLIIDDLGGEVMGYRLAQP